MFAVLGILVSLALLIGLAYRGWNVILLAPICALVAAVLSIGDETPLLATYTQVFMPALGNYLLKFFPLFLLGAVFGKLMDDSGCARAIAHQVVAWTGKERAILAIVLACGILTYGGVSLFVVAFAVFPIALRMFREGNIPKRLIPAAIALGSFTFTMTALPGTPAIQNAIPIPFFGTNTFAAPGLSVIAALIMFGAGTLWLALRSRRMRGAGEGFGEDVAAAPGALKVAETEAGDVPPFWIAIIPVLLVLGINFVFTKYIGPSMDTDFLATAKYGKTTAGAVSGIWAIIVAMVVACVVLIGLTWKRFASVQRSVNEGALGSMLPILNVASEVAYGAVIASLAGFAIVRDWLTVGHDRPGDRARADRQRARGHHRLGLGRHEHRAADPRRQVPRGRAGRRDESGDPASRRGAFLRRPRCAAAQRRGDHAARDLQPHPQAVVLRYLHGGGRVPADCRSWW